MAKRNEARPSIPPVARENSTPNQEHAMKAKVPTFSKEIFVASQPVVLHSTDGISWFSDAKQAIERFLHLQQLLAEMNRPLANHEGQPDKH